MAAVTASSSRHCTTSPPSPWVIHSSIVIASPMTSGSREAMHSSIDAGVASVDASDTARSDDAQKNGQLGRGDEVHARRASPRPRSFTQPRTVSVMTPSRAARISRARGSSACARANARSTHVEVRVLAVVAKRQHDQRVVGPAEPGRERRVVALLRPERAQVDVPDDPVDRCGVGTQADGLLGVAERRDDEPVAGRDRLGATHLRPRGRSLPYVKMSVFHGLMTSGCTSASAAQWPYGSR